MSTAAAVSPPWTELPSDLTANILQRLGAEEILQSAQLVCATWWKVCHDPAMWRVIKFVYTNNSLNNMLKFMHDDHYCKLTRLCRRAVDLSQGQLLDLTIAYFGDDELLQYIVDRSSHLRRLTVVFCFEISAAALINSLKKLPELEEFELNILPFAEQFEGLGNACATLKSFTLNNILCMHTGLVHEQETIPCLICALLSHFI